MRGRRSQDSGVRSQESGFRSQGAVPSIPYSLFPIPFLWACAVLLLASLPYIVGLSAQPASARFVGFTYNIDDACVYSSWIRQIADGNLLIRNQFTSEPQTALQFNVFFLVLGLLSKVTHLSPAAVMHLARVVLGIGLLALVWRFSGRVLKEPTERLLIVPVIGLSSGLGWLVAGIGGHMGPVDLWQPEAITFLSIYLNPLFLVGLILMVASLHFLLRMKESGGWRDAALAGVMLLLLGNVHTYDLATVAAVWAAYLAVKIIRRPRIPWRVVGLSAVAAAISLPAIGYQLYLYSQVEAFRLRVESPAPSPSLWAYFMGYGLLLALAVGGGWTALRQRRGALILVIWSMVGFALPYAPVAQQRKLVMGLHVPLAILATIAVAALAKRAGPRAGGIVAILLVAAMVPSNLIFMARDIELLGQNTTAPHYRPYLRTSELQALVWLREHSKPEDTVLAFPDVALFVPAIAGNRVYYGHWSETPDYGGKLNEWMEFVRSTTSDDWRRDFLIWSGARYIVYFSQPAGTELPVNARDPIALFDLRKANYVKVVFEQDDTAVYQVL